MKSSPMQLPDDYILKKCVVQTVTTMKSSTKMSQLMFNKEKSMTLGEFKELAKSFEKHDLTQTELENLFWNDVQQSDVWIRQRTDALHERISMEFKRNDQKRISYSRQ